MNDWFMWNGEKCTEYGMHLLTPPSFIVAQERTTSIEVPGRSGTLTMREGDYVHKGINLSAICIIDSPYISEADIFGERVSRIARWLAGDGKVTFWTRQDGYHKGRIANQISFDKILRGNPHRSFSLEFQCDPYFYFNSGEAEIDVWNDLDPLTNPGNVPAEPLIRIEGKGDGTIICGNTALLIDDISDLDYMMVDCAAKIAYKGEYGDPNDPLILLNSRISGDWPVLPVGETLFNFSGSYDRVIVTPRWRCL